MTKVFLVVAESSRAKIFQTDMHLSEMIELEDMVHPASRQHERDITSDLPGRGASSGEGSHHGIDDQSNARKEEVDIFARQIDKHLAAMLDQGQFEKLALVASPKFLGHLRKHLSGRLADKIVYELDKDLLHCKETELKAHLPAHF